MAVKLSYGLIQKPESRSFPVCYVREKIRTPDTLVRSQVLYPAELHTHNIVHIERIIYYISFLHLSIVLKKISLNPPKFFLK